MKQPLIRIFASTILAMVLCQVAYTVTRKGLVQFDIHKESRLNEIIKGDSAYNMLYIGSSRTHTTIHPGVVDSILGTSSFNAGVEGGMIDDFYLTYKAYLHHHKPPTVLVLTLDLWSLMPQKTIFNYIQYFPYADNEIIAEHLESKGYFMTAYEMLPFLSMAHYDDYTRFNAIKGLRGQNEIPAGDFQYRGYLSNGSVYMNPVVWTEPKQKKTVDVSAAGTLQLFIETCKKDGTHLIVAYAPEYHTGLKWGYKDPELFFTTVDSICKTNNIPFVRHDSLSMNNDPKLFANPGHVNIAGAAAYSIELANYLQENAYFNAANPVSNP